MAIKVCDTIMGSGKSSAAITYMNEHPQQKFIYITPYLEEASRIRQSCPELNFKEPSDKLPEFGFKKYRHLVELMVSGENITSTHNMFLRYSEEMIEIIKKQEYILIVDEAVDVLRPSTVTTSDVKLFEAAGWIVRENGVIKATPAFQYENGVASEIAALIKGNRLLDIPDEKNEQIYYYWLFSEEILKAFSNVYILTYMFDSQTMKYYLDLTGMEYQKIGVSLDASNTYRFSNSIEYIPTYTESLSGMVHIFDNKKINAIGDNKNALSSTWYKRLSGDPEKRRLLKNNVNNYFMHYNSNMPVGTRLWATYKNGESYVRAKGFYYSNIAFNAKATNDYRDKQVLAYCVNIFMQPDEKNYLIKNGIDVQEEQYALSVMIQWIWRSAIRDGKEIWIYIPSSRMRRLLRDWIENTEQEYKKFKGEIM